MKKIIFFITLFCGLIHADLVTLYKTKGLMAVEDKLDTELEKKTFWNSYLENKNVDYGYYESKEFVIITQKENKELMVFEIDNNRYNLLFKHNVILGEKEGDKFVEGDLKTPEGAYELTKKITKLDPFYGPLALVTNYPNTFDKSINKKGYGIWIHGMPLNQDREEFTKGCIALDNPQLKELDSVINYEKSILLISHDEIKKATKEEISTVLAGIYEWRNAWKKSDIDRYLSFYSESFKRKDGMKLDRFKEHKKRIFSRNEKKIIDFSDINVVPYPNSLNKQMYKIVLHEDYKTKSYTFEGRKELYIELKNDKIKILAES